MRLGDLVRANVGSKSHDGIITYLDDDYAELTKMNATMCQSPHTVSGDDWIGFHYKITTTNLKDTIDCTDDTKETFVLDILY